MKCLNEVKTYVPRHMRLGICADVPEPDYKLDVVQDVPVVDEFGSVVYTQHVIKQVPADEVMQKYKSSAFCLSALVRAGVPLKVVNVNNSSSVTIDKLQSICQSIDDADKYVNKVLEQQKERESWFKPIEVESDVKS